jgi:hypothetical protein
MQKHTTIAIEGPDASRALDELLAIPGIETTRNTSHPTVVYRDASFISVAGEIVGIVSGIASIVDLIIEWREKWLKGRGSERMSAVIEDTRGNRLLLQSATPEQLTEVLKGIAAAKPG